MIVQRLTTPRSEAQMLEDLRDGHVMACGRVPEPNRLAGAWGQCALEHGRGVALYCFNYGNVTAGPSWTGDLYIMKVPPPDPPQLKFRAFASPAGGAAAYWRILLGRYASGLALYDAGRFEDAARELGRLRYYTANPDHYAPAVASLARYALKALIPNLAPPRDDVAHEPGTDDGEARSILSPLEVARIWASVSAATDQLIDDMDLARPTGRDREG